MVLPRRSSKSLDHWTSLDIIGRLVILVLKQPWWLWYPPSQETIRWIDRSDRYRLIQTDWLIDSLIDWLNGKIRIDLMICGQFWTLLMKFGDLINENKAIIRIDWEQQADAMGALGLRIDVYHVLFPTSICTLSILRFELHTWGVALPQFGGVYLEPTSPPMSPKLLPKCVILTF